MKVAVTILVDAGESLDPIGDSRAIAYEMVDKTRAYARSLNATLELNDVSEYIPDAEDIIPS